MVATTVEHKPTANARMERPKDNFSVVVQQGIPIAIGTDVSTVRISTALELHKTNVPTVAIRSAQQPIVNARVDNVQDRTTATTMTATTARQTAPVRMATILHSIVLVVATLRVTAVAETEAQTLRRAKPIVQARTSILVQRSA